MNLYDLFISASPRLKDPAVRSRAEILAGSVIARGLLLISIFVSKLFFGPAFPTPLIFVALLTVAIYVGARSRHFEWAAIVMIADPILFNAICTIFTVNDLNAHPQGPMILALGPVIASVVLSRKATILCTVATAAVFALVFVRADPKLYNFMLEEDILIFGIAFLSIITVSLREKAETELQAERAKSLQASKLAALGKMAGATAHELNSPLAAACLHIEVLEADLKNPEIDRERMSRQLTIVMTTLERMAKIIRELKNISHDDLSDQ